MLLKGAAGLVLIVAPAATARLLGLPSAGSGFWPRLLGAALIGIAAAAAIEGRFRGSVGLGLGGAMAINFIAAGTIASLLILGRVTELVRGRVVLWGVTVLLSLLGVVQIFYV